MNHIFISYRRDDAIYIVGRIKDRLKERFGKAAIFMDLEKIPLGIDFRVQLESSISQCKVLLAVIGQKWLMAMNDNGMRRLDTPTDFVRNEIEAALQREIPVIPLLVRGVRMPTADELPASMEQFAFRNGMPIRSEPDFENDMKLLIDNIERHLESVEEDIWRQTKAINTVLGYQDYLSCFPAGTFNREAEQEIRASSPEKIGKTTSIRPAKMVEPTADSTKQHRSFLPPGRAETIVRRLTVMLIIFEFAALGVFYLFEIDAARKACVILLSSIGIGLLVFGGMRRKIMEISLGFTGGIAPWLLVLLAGPMITIGITAATSLILGSLVLKDLRQMPVDEAGEY